MPITNDLTPNAIDTINPITPTPTPEVVTPVVSVPVVEPIVELPVVTEVITPIVDVPVVPEVVIEPTPAPIPNKPRTSPFVNKGNKASEKLFPENDTINTRLTNALAVLTNKTVKSQKEITDAHNVVYTTLISILSNTVVYNDAVAKALVYKLLDYIQANKEGFSPFTYFSGVKNTHTFTEVDEMIYSRLLTLLINLADTETRKEQLNSIMWAQLKHLFSKHSSGEVVVERLLNIFNVQ